MMNHEIKFTPLQCVIKFIQKIIKKSFLLSFLTLNSKVSKTNKKNRKWGNLIFLFVKFAKYFSIQISVYDTQEHSVLNNVRSNAVNTNLKNNCLLGKVLS